MQNPEREFDFTLVLSGVSEISDEITDRLFKAGCDDATLAIQSGRATLSFSRSAPDFTVAMASALRDVTGAGFKTTLL